MLNDTVTRAMTVFQVWPQKAKKWAVAQFLEIPASFPQIIKVPSPSLAYEITQPLKTNHPIFWGLLPSKVVHTLSVECVSPLAALFPRWPHVLGLLLPFEPDCILSMEYVSLWTKNTFYLSLCHSLNSFCKRRKRTWVSLSPKTRYIYDLN